MVTVCPTITAFDRDEYDRQIRAVAGFAGRIHIDLMDGEFAPTVSPGLDEIWWPETLIADIHLMYQRPMEQLDKLIELSPARVIVHLEAEVDHVKLADELHKYGIELGLALLQDSPVEWARQIIPYCDQVLVFSGNLGHHGGEADLGLLEKVGQIKAIEPTVDVAWDGGISDQNVDQLCSRGIETLNVGGFIQKSSAPQEAYAKIKMITEKYNDKTTA